jgi:hypothetical protein
MNRNDLDKDVTGNQPTPARSRDAVMDTIRRALLSTGVPALDRDLATADRAEGADPYNSTGRTRIRDAWARR